MLTLGVSHAPIVTRRGHSYIRPLTAMREHLDGMAATRYAAPAPAEPAPLLLAALAPGMMRLAAERADGAHPYLVTPEHTATARATLGPGKILAPEQGVVLQDDPETARAAARQHLAVYLPMENYTRCWRGSASRTRTWRTAAATGSWTRSSPGVTSRRSAARVGAHLDAGADHVSVQALGPDPLAQLERLAPVLTALPPGHRQSA